MNFAELIANDYVIPLLDVSLIKCKYWIATFIELHT